MENEEKKATENGAKNDKKEYEEPLESTVSGLRNTISDLTEQVTHLKEVVAQYQKMIFGQSSEKTKYTQEMPEQLSLFNEAEIEAKPNEKEKTVVIEKHERKAKRTHEELIANLPVEEVVLTIPEEERSCGKCGSELIPIGKEKVCDKLVIIPAQFKIERTYRESYKCESCGVNEEKDSSLPDIEKQTIVKAPVPEPVIPNSLASASAVTYVMYEKYANAMPLYRMEQDFKNKGIGLPRATLANWIIAASARWLEPLWQAMKNELMQSRVIQADETTVQVLNEPGRKPGQKSYMWVYCSGEFEKKSAVLYEYARTRVGTNAGKFLEGYHEYLVVDGYDGYNDVKAKRCGCWAHLRRRFKEAIPDTDAKNSKAKIGFEYCNSLFAFEKEFKELPSDERHKRRSKSEEPLLDEFWLWIDTLTPVGGTKLAKAISYARNEKKYLNAFLTSPDVPISNNRCENAIRPFTVGRKNWLFSTSPKGAKSSAMVYSIIESAKANNLNPYAYLLHIFTTLPQLKLNDETLLSFLPWSDDLPDECRRH